MISSLPLVTSWFDLVGSLSAGCLVLAFFLLRLRLRRQAELQASDRLALLELRRHAGSLAGRLAVTESALPESAPLHGVLLRRLGEIEAIAGDISRSLALAIAEGDRQRLLQSAEHARHQAGQLVELAAGGRARERQTSLGAIWPRVPALVGPGIEQCTVKVQFDEAVGPVVGAGETWVQILLALVQNAVDAMPLGGTIEVGCAAVGPHRDHVRVWVSDNGPGMKPEVVERVLRRDRDPLPARRGQGLGLPLVQSLVEGLGGRMAILSQRGAGTSVDIEVPAAIRMQAQAELPKLTGTVLVADDEALVREAMCRVLQRAGLETVAVDGGVAALSALKTGVSRFSAMVLDVVMPGTPVGDLVALARQASPEIPVLLVSGYATEPMVEPILALGGVRYLHKPMTPQQLAQSLADLCSPRFDRRSRA